MTTLPTCLLDTRPSPGLAREHKCMLDGATAYEIDFAEELLADMVRVAPEAWNARIESSELVAAGFSPVALITWAGWASAHNNTNIIHEMQTLLGATYAKR